MEWQRLHRLVEAQWRATGEEDRALRVNLALHLGTLAQLLLARALLPGHLPRGFSMVGVWRPPPGVPAQP